jgi:hypothetical protein
LWDEQTRARASTIFLPDHQLNMRKNMLNSARMQLKCLAPTATNDASPVLGQALFPILIVRNDLAYRAHSSNIDHASVQGWDIIVPSRWGASIFNHLHLLGGRVAGIEELEYLHLYHGHISFPRDFPDTEAGETYWLDKSVERNKKIYLWNKCKPTKAAKATYSGDISDSSDESDNDDDASHCSDSEMVVEEVKGSTTDSHREPVTNMNIVVEAAEEEVPAVFKVFSKSVCCTFSDFTWFRRFFLAAPLAFLALAWQCPDDLRRALCKSSACGQSRRRASGFPSCGSGSADE